jgi:hypothetical protein
MSSGSAQTGHRSNRLANVAPQSVHLNSDMLIWPEQTGQRAIALLASMLIL